MEELDKQLELLLSIYREHHLMLAPCKFQLAQPGQSLLFAGHRVSGGPNGGCEPDPDHIFACRDFPRPENRKQLQSLLWLIAQFLQ